VIWSNAPLLILCAYLFYRLFEKPFLAMREQSKN